MIGHSTLLLEGDGTKLLTDPYFGLRGHLAYARRGRPSLSREALRDVDGVLVSHAHWDHTDRAFFRDLPRSTPVVTPSRTSLIFALKGVRDPSPLAAWQRCEIGSAAVTAVPASHIARTNGYVIEMGGVTAYFSGDTYHRSFMREIGAKFSIDVAMMPVTTFLIPPTMGERGAVAATRDLGAHTVIPIHRGVTPRMPLLRGWESVDRFEERLRSANVHAEVVRLREGETWTREQVALTRAVS